ncbi:hypothetical protein [Rheinheimera sp.]|uniref:hypothetical protein n=1 Tax=Rheinheimera sp. TaxID=1869214 RepID=UPI0027343017|nr:hypothetical protein [Rheinheimera sp.]MDP2713557.1 hypothetical protein [Rheinheimera sp.]
MIARIKTISFGASIAAMLITLVLLLGNVEFYGLLSAYIFLVLWSLDNVFLWCIDDDFGIASQLTIKKDAPKAIRFLGLIFVCFTLYIGLKGLIEHVST